MNKDDLKLELKQHMIKYLNLMDYTPETIEDNAPLFGPDGIGLDSIDSLELIVMLEREYGIKLTNPTEARNILVNVTTIAEFIIAEKSK